MFFSVWFILLQDIGIPLPFAAGVVRLVNGIDECSGRVEVYMNGQWGTVCDDYWDIYEAAVVCREVGCGIALEATSLAFFGVGSGEIWMDDVGCMGTETTLENCGYAYPSNCEHTEDAGVICQSLRLMNGSSMCSGRVEVFHSGTWGTVCNNSWDMKDAAVICRELGCGAPKEVNTFFGEGSGQIWMDNVNCLGSETRLTYCKSNAWGVNSCGHASDAGVVCQELKLVGAADPCSGTIQILHNSEWGTVCQGDWDASDAAVVCRELGCGSHVEAKTDSFFVQGVGPTWMDFVNCKGDESELKTCAFSGWGAYSCDHQYDAGVVCKEFKARNIMRIKVTVSPGVDANDPEFELMIMEMMKAKMDEMGNYTLRWRTQLDGQVFEKMLK